MSRTSKWNLVTGSVITAVSLALAMTALSADWPQWRGPQRDDHSPDTGLLKQWPEGGPKRLWLNKDVGLGYAGYSIVGDKLYTIGMRGEQEFLLALDATNGKELWAVPMGPSYSNPYGNGPRDTPTVNDGSVYALTGKGALICAQANDGKILWKKSLISDLNGTLPNWGYTESVLVVGNLVVCTPGGAQGTMAALDKKTGELAWRSKGLTDPAHYSSAILIEHAGKPQILQLVMTKFFGVDPANGSVLWKQEWSGATAVIPTPIYHDGYVYVTSGYKAGCTLAKLDAKNEATRVYKNNEMENHHGGVVLVGDYIYGFANSGGGAWVCQTFLTGEKVWSSKALGKGAIHYADGMLYCLSESSGEVALIEASNKGWNEHGRFKLEAQSSQRSKQGAIWTHPVVINGRLYLRDQEFLSCYDVKG